jgi:8-oxo-dGTP pyrophosphatase MutT (NUDIX family)
MTGLGADWVPDARGIPRRRAARVVLFDPSGRVLLALGHDRHRPGRHWWFTIGGGVEAGEAPREAACRELREETGISIAPDALEGPVLHRRAVFDFSDVTARQEEWFFLARTRSTVLDRSGWTADERDLVEGQRWWDLAALASEAERTEVFPRELPSLAQGWRAGWDGRLVEISEF